MTNESIIKNTDTKALMNAANNKIKELRRLESATASVELKQKCNEAIKAIYHAIHLCIDADCLQEELYPEN